MRCMLGLRVTEKLYRTIVEAASKSGRSISQEAELRIEKSFWLEEITSPPSPSQ